MIRPGIGHAFVLGVALGGWMGVGAARADGWRMGDPIVTYWAGPGFPGGPPLDEAAAQRLADGGFTLAWCGEAGLPVAARHGLRGLLADPLLDPKALDDGDRRAALEALIDRARRQPALYAYHLTDEPSAAAFPALGRLVSFLRERDPAHLAYINLLPIYASNVQLGVPGPRDKAYAEHLRRFAATVRPDLLSYDHYQFTRSGDNPDYFLNLAMVRRQADASRVPFLNIIQACSWVPGAAASPTSPRVPDADEVRYLLATTLAYGGQGVSYYVHGFPGHEGGLARPDGTSTPLGVATSAFNREFSAVARELQPLQSLGVYHAGMLPPGAVPLPADFPFRLEPPEPSSDYRPGDRVRGVLIGHFGPSTGGRADHLLIVNLDYRSERVVTIGGPAPIEQFDPAVRRWLPTSGPRAELMLPRGGGRLVRSRP